MDLANVLTTRQVVQVPEISLGGLTRQRPYAWPNPRMLRQQQSQIRAQGRVSAASVLRPQTSPYGPTRRINWNSPRPHSQLHTARATRAHRRRRSSWGAAKVRALPKHTRQNSTILSCVVALFQPAPRPAVHFIGMFRVLVKRWSSHAKARARGWIPQTTPRTCICQPIER